MGSLVLMAGCDPERSSTAQDGVLEYEIATSAHAGECTIVFEPTGVTLRSDLSGTIPDPDPYWVSRDGGGRFYTGTPEGGRVAVWPADGTFLRTIGRPGEGPGELGLSPLPIVDGRDHVHVLDPTRGLWSRFTPEGRFLSSTTSPVLSHVIVAAGRSAIVGEDSVLTSSPSPVFSSYFQFHILNGEGVVERAFGKLPPVSARDWARSAHNYARHIAFTSRRTFWAAPWPGSKEYVLEEWTLDGSLVRRLRREAPWPISDAVPNAEGDVGSGYPLIKLALGPEGRLIVSAMFNLDRTNLDKTNRAEVPVDALHEGRREHWFEVIDPQVPELLASTRMQTEGAGNTPRFGMFAGTPLGIWSKWTELDLPVIDIVRYRLAPKGDAGAGRYECS